MNEEEYLRLFNNQNKEENFENLNETKQTWESLNKPQQTWESLNKPQQNQWQNINETPNTQQYNINENVNDGWSNKDFVIEQRINGVPQQQNNHPYHSNPRRGGGLNGLDQFLDDDLREVVRQPVAAPPVQQVLAPPAVDNIKDVEVVSIEMFENMNSNALLTLANGKLSQIDASKVTGGGETTVRFLNS